jgi:hypothetical protein
MDTIKSKLTVLFEEPFWIGMVERECAGKYEVCKITFGPEPKDYQIYEFFQINWKQLKFCQSIEVTEIAEKKISPKRMQRVINRQLKDSGVGTKAQQALKLQQEQSKVERKVCSRERKEAEKERQFAIKQEKRKEKHRGH